jgi:hypothetical protein
METANGDQQHDAHTQQAPSFGSRQQKKKAEQLSAG